MRQLLSQSEVVVGASGLVKRYGRTRALDGLDLEVHQGRVHGFLGPNGAGKSTTIRALLGQLRLHGGRLTVFGLDPWRDAPRVHGRLAYVPGDVSLWPGLTGGECIDVLGRFQGRQDPRRRDQLIERFELDPTKRASSYSKGNRQKVALVAALAYDAELYVFDEPTSGLDPLMEAEFQQVVRELHAGGATVLLSSHILAEVEALCDEVTIIRSGRAVSSGTLEDLRAGATLSVRAVTTAPITGLTSVRGVTHVSTSSDGDGIRTDLTATREALPQALEALSKARPRDLAVAPPSLEQLFLEHYEDDARDIDGVGERVSAGATSS